MQNTDFLKIACLILCLTGSPSSIYAQFAGPHLLPPSNGLQQQLYFYHHPDLDADGSEDLITTKSAKRPGTNNSFYYIVEWHRNDGAGNYETAQPVSPTGHPYFNTSVEITTVDLDGNGFVDIVYRQSSSVAWQANNGNGNFGPLKVLIPGSLNVDVQFGDMDNDGDLDMVGGILSGVRWWVNDGAGNFQDAGVIISPASNTIELVRLADLNGDDLLDVIVIGWDAAGLRWFPNLGGGAFGPLTVIDGALANITDWDLQCADLDGDGDTDLLGGHHGLGSPNPPLSDAELMWWANDGAGNFSSLIPIFTGVPFGGAYFSEPISVADFNGDGAVDILTSIRYDYNAKVVVWSNQNDGTGTFIPVNFANDVKSPALPQITDQDSDGWPDLSVQIGYSIYSFRNDGAGSFEPIKRVYYGNMAFVASFRLDDLDGNASPDLLYNHTNGDVFAGWHANLGAGQFGALQQLTTGFTWTSNTLTGDLDGDGDADLLLQGGNNAVLRKMNNGAGGFSSDTSLFVSFRFSALHDLDGDLDLDLIGLSFSLGKYGWLTNDGTGNFFNFQPFNWQHQEYAPDNFCDMDNDEDLDLLSQQNNEAYWYVNNGNGVFDNDQTYGTYVNAYFGLSGADMDSDGDQDVLVSNWASVIWFANQGGGVFDIAPRVFESNPKGHVRALAADFDQDGDNDVVTASVIDSLSSASGKFAWYENLGGGEFAAPQYFGKVADCLSLQADDLDGDGDLDLAWHSSYDIGWWENLHGTPYISGACFWDKNENKTWDSGELPAAGVELSIQPAGLLTYATSDGGFKFFVSSGDYTLSYKPNACWELTTDSSEYQLISTDTNLSGYQFGFKRSNDNRYVRPILAGGLPRCNTDAPFWITLVNRSCNEAAGRVALVLDNLVTFVSAAPAPAMVNGDTLWWNFDTIQPLALGRINLMLKITGTTGDTIHLQAFTWLDEPNGSFTFSDATTYLTEIRCSFDPNDKMVDRPTVPKDYSPEGYELIYTIRFQNTGNDTAFLVRLRDTLSADLDWTTLRPLGSSHPFYTVLNTQTGLLQFTFEDIIMPDSTTNFAESQGFVQFAVQLLPGLPPGTVVPNRAGIYFDANPVVLTNTAETAVLEPVGVLSPVEAPVFLVQPNPTTGICTLRLTQPAKQDALLEVLDTQGRRMCRLAISPGIQEHTIDLSDFPAGLYLIRLLQAGQGIAAVRIVRQ